MWLLYIFTNGYIGPCVCVYDFRFVNMHHLCLIRNQADLWQSIQVCIHYIDKLLFNTKHSYFLNICIQYATPTLFCMVLNKIIGKFLHHNLMNIIISGSITEHGCLILGLNKRGKMNEFKDFSSLEYYMGHKLH